MSSFTGNPTGKDFLRIERAWAMPNRKTFSIKPIRELLAEEMEGIKPWMDPFAGDAQLADHTNDLRPDTLAKYHWDALDFIHYFLSDSVGGVLLDPPYSPRQVAECYKGVGRKVTSEDTRSTFWTKIRRETARVVRPGGKVISFGWNSNGVGKKLCFKIERILIVAHGGIHNDTIVVVETKQ